LNNIWSSLNWLGGTSALAVVKESLQETTSVVFISYVSSSTPAPENWRPEGSPTAQIEASNSAFSASKLETSNAERSNIGDLDSESLHPTQAESSTPES